MQINEQSKPWHSYPLVWMMIAIPFTAVIMGVIMIWLAVDTDDGLVADDYYKLGLEINRVISRDKKAAELKLSAVVTFDNSTNLINLKFEKGLLETFPKTLQLKLQHATRENSDATVILNHGIGDQYIGHVKQVITNGIWYFNLVDEDWKLNARTYVGKDEVINLQSGY